MADGCFHFFDLDDEKRFSFIDKVLEVCLAERIEDPRQAAIKLGWIDDGYRGPEGKEIFNLTWKLHLERPLWKSQAAAALDRDGGRCRAMINGERCLEEATEVHHRSYTLFNRFYPPLSALISLCRNHHEMAKDKKDIQYSPDNANTAGELSEESRQVVLPKECLTVNAKSGPRRITAREEALIVSYIAFHRDAFAEFRATNEFIAGDCNDLPEFAVLGKKVSPATIGRIRQQYKDKIKPWVSSRLSHTIMELAEQVKTLKAELSKREG